MELIDRYLQAIEFWLPKRQRQDIIAELSEDLRSQIEEKETELGRKLRTRKWKRSSSAAVRPWLWRHGIGPSNT